MGKHKRKKSAASGAAAPAMTRREREELEAKKYKRTKLFLVIFAIVALVAIIGTVLVISLGGYFSTLTIDYENDDLSRYIEIDKADYLNWKTTARLDPVDDIAVRDTIMGKLFNHRGKQYVEGAINKGFMYNYSPIVNGTKRLLGVGDAVFAYYRGYYEDENGEPVYFDGGSNFASVMSDETPTVEIGSGAMFVGLELNLVGQEIDGHSLVERESGSKIALGDVVRITYSVIYSNEEYEDLRDVTTLITVDPEICDAEFGEGFANFLIGKGVGEFDLDYSDDKNKILTTTTDGGTTKYYDFSALEIFEPMTPLKIEARVPVSYPNLPEIEGKTVYFDWYTAGVIFYTVPELNDSFIQEKLGMDENELADYGKAGDTLVARYESYLKAQLEISAKEAAKEALEGKMWEHYLDVARVKWLPEGEVKIFYDSALYKIYAGYESYGDSYDSVSHYAAMRLELEEGEAWIAYEKEHKNDWQGYLRITAERSLVRKLAFYYILRAENLYPSEEEYEELYNEAVDTELEMELLRAGITESSFDSKEKYDAEVKAYRELIIETLGESYFKDEAIYVYAVDKMIGFIDVTYVD